MSKTLENKIEATDTTIKELLENQKFYIDYFQREYRWKEKHIKLLIEDLSTTFLKSYVSLDKRSAVANYQKYYLGSVVFSIDSDTGKKSIIDGQQRITSITLLLIYLNNLQKDKNGKVSIERLIFSEKFGEQSYNMTDKLREPCLKSLFSNGSYELCENDDETVRNMLERYDDIVQSFPEELTLGALPYFIDWFVENVVVVKIAAYSDENAYTIFETMNDRGLNLTPTEMLKGYVLSKITNSDQRIQINNLWKEQIQKLHSYGETTNQSFFQAWFRGKYAVSIRSGEAGSENQDFELIGSQFHSWFKDNHSALFKLETSDDFFQFFSSHLPFYAKWYLEVLNAQKKYDENMPHLHYVNFWGIAESLQNPLILASIGVSDDESTIKKKIDYTARYIETFTVRRAVNYKKFGQTSIKYKMFNSVRLIRDSELKALGQSLSKEIEHLDQKWDGINNFRLHGQNRKFVKHLLSRVSGYLDELVGKDSNYVSYHHPKGKPFEIEHIWGNSFDEHKDEFEQEHDFKNWRNSIGALILLPNGTNQSFSSDKYEEKIDHYIKENVYAQTLNKLYYERNPNFLKSESIKDFSFQPYTSFDKSAIEERNQLIRRICERLWSTDYFSLSQ